MSRAMKKGAVAPTVFQDRVMLVPGTAAGAATVRDMLPMAKYVGVEKKVG